MATKKNLIIGLISILLFFGLVFYLNTLVPTENDAQNKELKQVTAPKDSDSQLLSDDGIKFESPVSKKNMDASVSSKKEKLFELSKIPDNSGLASVPRKVPGTLGVTEKGLAILHQQQMQAIEARLQDPNEIIVPPSGDGQPGITRGEITALHQQQMQAIEARLQDPNEIIVPPSGDGQPGITRGEITALHQQQMQAIEARLQDPDEIVVPPSEDGQPGITRREITALHQQQMQAIEARLQDPNEIVIPPSEDGQQGITGYKLLDLHDEQMENLDLENNFFNKEAKP